MARHLVTAGGPHAVPRRLPVLWGKAIVFALTTLVLCLPATLAAFLVGQSILSAERLDISLGDPGVARAVFGSALFLSAVGLLGLGLGGRLRSAAGAVAGLFGLLLGPSCWPASCPPTGRTGCTPTCPCRPVPPSPTCGPTRRRSPPGPGSGCSVPHGGRAGPRRLAAAPP
jgi:hypothetical protein